jgi:hypothetical protein
MKIKVFYQYQKLAQAGRVKPLACPMHQEDLELIFPLIIVEENEKIMLQCLACSYKNIVGYQLYENLIEQIRKIENA